MMQSNKGLKQTHYYKVKKCLIVLLLECHQLCIVTERIFLLFNV